MFSPLRRSPFAPLLAGAVLLAACTAFAPRAFAAPTSYTWKNVVIKGGGFVSGLVYHPTTPDVFYARTDVGGAFRWIPATGSWLPLTDHLGQDDSQLTGVVSLALDPNDARRVYLACGQYLPWWAQHGAILASTDQGATWSRTDLSINLGGNSDGRSTGERLQVDPNLGAILFLGTNQDGLWQSTDYAQTWTRVNSFTPASINLVVFDPRSGSAGHATQKIYVGVNSTTSSSLYRSTDGGATWSAVPGQPAGLMPHHAKFAADGTLFISYSNGLGPNDVTSGAVWKLHTDTGVWTNITPPTGQGGFAGLALDPQKPGTLLVTTLDRWSPRDEIYRSTDAGATWKALNAVSARDGSSAPYSDASTPHWLGDIEIDPFNSARAFYVTGYGVFGTETLTHADTGGTITWLFRNDGLEETVPLNLVSPPSGAPLVSALGDIDGFRHDDLDVATPRGRHTPRVGTTYGLDFAELAPAIMVRTHPSGTTKATRSTDGGTTWSYFASSPATAASGEGFIAVAADGGNIVWAPSRSVPYVSTNNGATWTASTGIVAPTGSNVTPVADRANAAKFYVYSSDTGRVYVSSNGGVSFAQTAATLPTGGEPPRAVPGHEGHLWFTAWKSGLYRSTDSGASFTKLAGVAEANRLGFGKAAAGATYPAIYLWGKIGGTTGFYRSDDEGSSWVRINDDAHQFGWINTLIGDPRIYGRVYLATGGRGILHGDLTNTPPAITWLTPRDPVFPAGETARLSAALGTIPTPAFVWERNGTALINSSTTGTLTLDHLHPLHTGLYAPVATSAGSTFTADPAIVGVFTTSKVIGDGAEITANVKHPNGNIYDPLSLNGAAAALTADAGQATRISFVDLNDDIVQVEFAGAGTLSVVLDDVSGPAAPVNYNQPQALYMKGHAGIVITGADESTNVTIFSVGRATAFDPTGQFDLAQPISDTNKPANNASPLFSGHANTAYDGVADIAFIAISSRNGKFGGIRTANTSYFATRGLTGIYAPGVTFLGPVYVHDINASGTATPALLLGAVSDARVTGGSLEQDNGKAVRVSGITQLKFTAGVTSHNQPLPAQPNQAKLEQDGVDVTAQTVVNP